MVIEKQKISDDDYLWFKGDCFEMLQAVPDKSVQLVFTSPPYNIGKEYEEKMDLAAYLSDHERLIRECNRVLTDTGSICWQTGNYVERDGEIIPLDILLYRIFAKEGFKMRNRIVWTYEHGMHARNKFSGRYETISWYSKSDDYVFHLDPIRVPQKQPSKKFYKGPRKGEVSSNPLGKNPGDVWAITNVKNAHPEKIEGGHPCQFPLELAERIILSLTDEGQMVVDPFGGTATTLVAALRHGRRALSAEIESKYHKLGNERIKKFLKGELPYNGRFKEMHHDAF